MTDEPNPDPWAALRAHLSPSTPPDETGGTGLRRPPNRRLVILAGPALAASVALVAFLARPTGARGVAVDDLAPSSTSSVAARPQATSRAGGILTTATGRFELASPKDRIALGDWDCDGEETPAVLVVASGEVFSYGSWADDSRTVEGRLVRIVPGASDLVAIQGDADGCGELEVHRSDGSTLTVEVPS